MTLRERLAASVTELRDRGRRLAQLNRELLTSELKQKGGRFGGAVGLFVGAGVVALYAIGFLLATIAVALALVLPLWLSLLIVTLVLFIVVAIMILVGRSLVRRAETPAPQVAAAEARQTAELVRTNVRETVEGVRARMRRKTAPRQASPWPSDAAGVPPSPASPPTPTPGSAVQATPLPGSAGGDDLTGERPADPGAGES